MKIALPTINGSTVTSHFGRTKAFVVVDIADGAETARETRDVALSNQDNHQDPGHRCRPDVLVGTISDCAVVIAGGMGQPVKDRLEHAGIEAVLTATASIEEVVREYAAGTLDIDPDLVHGQCGGHGH